MFSPDGQYLAVGYYQVQDRGNLCEVWDLALGKKLWSVRLIRPLMHGGCFAFSPDSHSIAIGLAEERFGRPDDRLALLDVATGEELKTLGRGLRPEKLAFHPDGGRIAVSGPDGRVRVIDAGTAAVVAALPHPAGTCGIAWSGDGGLLAAGCSNGRIYVWDAASGRLRSELAGHQSLPIHLAFDLAGGLLASHSWDDTALWDPVGGRPVVTASGRGLRFGPDGRQLAFARVAAGGLQLGIWDVADGRECRTLHHGAVGNRSPWPGSRSVSGVDFSPDGRLLASAGADGVHLWDPATAAHAAHLPPRSSHTVGFRPDGSGLLAFGKAGLHLWPVTRPGDGRGNDIQFGPAADLGLAGSNNCDPACWSSDGQLLACVDHRNHRALLLKPDGKVQTAFDGPIPNIISVALSPDGRWLATGTWKGSAVLVWDARTGKPVRTLDTARATTGTAAVAFSPDGQWLVTGGPGDYRFWRVGSWERGPVVVRDHEVEGPAPLAFAPDGTLLAVAWSAHLVKLIDPATGDEVAALDAPDRQAVSGLRFSPDGGRLAVATENHVVQLWDLRAVRRQLAGMGLDWGSAGGPTPPDAAPRPPLRVTVGRPPAKDFREERRLAAAAHQRQVPRLEKAVSDYGEALARRSDDSDALVKRASAYVRLGQINKAAADLARALELNPNLADACNELAWIRATGPADLRDPAKALALAQRAVRIAPADRDFRNTLGVVLYRLGQFDGAVDCFRQAAEAADGGATAHDLFFLAMCRHRLGDTPGALDAYEQAERWWAAQRGLSLSLIDELHAFRAEARSLLGIPLE
jgi:WD40 repeat protein/Tfp pilus assembly protein PilF